LSNFNIAKQPGSAVAGGGGHGFSASWSPEALNQPINSATSAAKAKKGGRGLFGRKSKPHKTGNSTLPSSANGGRKRRLLPHGVKRQDVMTRTVESMDEVFPWMCIEHMAGQESGWVMLEPVQDGAVGWVMIDKLEDGAGQQLKQQQKQQALQAQVA
jgi:hypothetical protein